MSVQELHQQLQRARRQIVTDGYEMSLGEIVSLYRSGDLVIDPAYQRLFRWDAAQKTRFIESVLLGLAVPTVFVFQRKDGCWELLDGLSPVMTTLELTGDLMTVDGRRTEPFVLGGTALLPALAGMSWRGTAGDDPDDDDDEIDGQALSIQLRLDIRRARVRVEILRNECGQDVKVALFQRFNSNGWRLSQKEIRDAARAMGQGAHPARP